MNKKELTNIIRKNAREQMKIYDKESEEWSNKKLGLKYEGASYGIRQFLVNLQKIGVIL